MHLIETTAKTSYTAAGLTTGAGAAAWSLSQTAALVGIIASIIGIICTVVTTIAVVRNQRRRTREQEHHNEKVRDIHREKSND